MVSSANVHFHLLFGFVHFTLSQMSLLCPNGRNKNLTILWSPYPKEIETRLSPNETVQTLDDLDGFSANIFAEFVKIFCLNVTLVRLENTTHLYQR